MKKIYTFLLLLTLSSTSIFAQLEGTWKIAPQGAALLVGPTQGDATWWSNSEGDVTARACFFDDEFVFNSDGSFENVMGTETWLETWQGVGQDECGAPVAPHDGSNAATWVDNGDGTFTVSGMGAHVGLPKVVNTGEINNGAAVPTSITYMYTIDGNTMTVDINYGNGGDGWWRFILEKNTTSVIDLVEDQFSFFPNPATTEIQVNSDEQLEELTIRDITGKVLVRRLNPSLNETIDVSALPAGLYLLESFADNKKSVEKLVIN